MKNISCYDLKMIMINNSNIVIIDIREEDEFRKGHIPTAINLPYSTIQYQLTPFLSYDKDYYVICDYGISSPKIVKQLSKFGYNATNIIGGMSKWYYSLAR